MQNDSDRFIDYAGDVVDNDYVWQKYVHAYLVVYKQADT